MAETVRRSKRDPSQKKNPRADQKDSWARFSKHCPQPKRAEKGEKQVQLENQRGKKSNFFFLLQIIYCASSHLYRNVTNVPSKITQERDYRGQFWHIIQTWHMSDARKYRDNTRLTLPSIFNIITEVPLVRKSLLKLDFLVRRLRMEFGDQKSCFHLQKRIEHKNSQGEEIELLLI